MTWKDLEKKWRLNLSLILDELTEDEFESLFLYLEKIPGKMKDIKRRAKMPQIIIKCYGLDMSIKVIKKAMDGIPRKDRKIQDLIRPILEKLEALNQQHTKNKRRSAGAAGGDDVQSPGRASKRKRQPNPEHEMDSGASMKAKRKKTKQKDSSLIGSSAALRKAVIPPLKQSIKLLKESGGTNGKPVFGKVVQKSTLRTYENKEKKKKYFFYLGVADETDCIKVMVYGTELFLKFQEGQLYLFKNVKVERVNDEMVMKVFTIDQFSKSNGIEVPKTLELEAQMLIYSQRPVCSIKKIQSFEERTPVSVEGTVIEINSVAQVKQERKRTKVNIRKFQLKDETGSICITLWRKDIERLRGTSEGDLVRVTNLTTNRYYETVSLNSTDFTRIYKVQAAAVQNVSMQIIGSREAERLQFKLDVMINDQLNVFVASSRLLAKAFGVKLDGNIEERLLQKLPFSAEAEIKGNQIQDLKATKEFMQRF